MPRIFLSPSLQPYNEYYGSGNEQEYMNKLADAMIPYLRTNGIQYTRNKIGTNVGQSIRDSNAGYYDLHLALHSNAAPESVGRKIAGNRCILLCQQPVWQKCGRNYRRQL